MSEYPVNPSVSDEGGTKPLIERLKTLRPARRVRRRFVQALFVLLSLGLAAEAFGAALRLAGVRLPFGP